MSEEKFESICGAVITWFNALPNHEKDTLMSLVQRDAYAVNCTLADVTKDWLRQRFQQGCEDEDDWVCDCPSGCGICGFWGSPADGTGKRIFTRVGWVRDALKREGS
jgi:hypothetical protein